jgi:hypothetical protein
VDGAAQITEFIVRRFEELLDLPEAGPAVHFFEAGGDSMGAVQLLAALIGQGWPVALDDLVSHPTPAELAAVIARTMREDRVVMAQGGRSGSLAERELLDLVEGEVLHRCQVALAPARVSVTRPIERVAGEREQAVIRHALEQLTGADLPDGLMAGSPAEIATHLRRTAWAPAMPFALSRPTQPDLVAPPTIIFGPSSATVFDLRRVVEGREIAGPVLGVVPLPHETFGEHALEEMTGALLPALREVIGSGPCRLAGYCTAAWYATHVGGLLAEAGETVTEVIAINPPTLAWLRVRRFRDFLAGTFLADVTEDRELWAEIDRLEDRWRAGECWLITAIESAVKTIAGALDRLLPNVADPAAYDAADLEVFLADLRASMTFQFAVGAGARPGDLPVTAIFSGDTAGPKEGDEALGTPVVSRLFDLPQRLLLRRPEPARIVLGTFREPV